MRAIERKMLKAIQTWTSWSPACENTKVIVDGPTATVYLFENRIATVNLFGVVKPDRFTVWEHPTRTTMSRLRALGVKANIVVGDPVVAEHGLLPVRINPAAP